MDKDIDFETYLFISPKKLIISVNQKKNFENIYQKEVLINNKTNQLQYEEIDNFLSQNIFSIEKILKDFIKKINLIIESEEFFPIQISFKRSNYGETISPKILNYLLNEAKHQCKKTSAGKKIIHMLIDNYLVDNNSYSYLPTKIKCKSFSLDLSIICLSDDLIKNLEKILRNYQISLNHILSAKYLLKFFNESDLDIFNMADKIIDGINKNEVKIISKINGKKGIFERFFDLFG
tara:strand:+ start:580 stop:1284 length:705 start_codon:yes stop_codon:yes gene_type:complete